jgi:hemoglobin/transferrin/lactoferrin receptor protein
MTHWRALALLCLAFASGNAAVALITPQRSGAVSDAKAEDCPPVPHPLRAEEEIVVTATTVPEPLAELPYSAAVVTRDELRSRQIARTLPEALDEMTGVAVQKTSQGQGSPYLRGLTGFHTVLLVNGIRLNNSVFRDGPNQYWTTVDPYGLDRVELVRGPVSVLYGSDAVGGTVNALASAPAGRGTSGRLSYRFASAERSGLGHAEVAGDLGARGRYRLGVSGASFGDLEAGGDVGRQPKTGYDTGAVDALFSYDLGSGRRLVGGHQRMTVDDAWRTHRTVYGISWGGTAVGNEKVHAFDQDRRLSFLQYRQTTPTPVFDELELTVSYHRQGEDRLRVRNDDRRDHQGFVVGTAGVGLRAQLQTRWGRLTYGLERYDDDVRSYSRRYTSAGQLAGVDIQGPVADDASYDSTGVYLQDELALGRRLRVIAGARYSRFELHAGSVEDPVRHTRISFDDRWSDVSGNLRALLRLDEGDRWQLFAGASQGFRAPNLSDLTRLDIARSNELEVPSPGLDPERFLAYEIGLRRHGARFEGGLTLFYTDVDGMIVRVPTGRTVDRLFEVTKRNAGDGSIRGAELELRAALREDLSVFGGYAWLRGDVEAFPGVDQRAVSEPLDKGMPPSGLLGVRWEPGRFWLELVVQAVEAQHRLSTRDAADTQRIPPGGTPGYTLVAWRGGVEIRPGLRLSLAGENLGDVEYRVHGSGVNGAGRNWVAAVDSSF